MTKIIDGRKIADKIKTKIAKDIFSFKKGRPNLAIILIGKREDSKLYVSIKEKEGLKVGVDTHVYQMSEKVSEEEVLGVIDFLNKDDLIDGILVQLPITKNLNTDKIVQSINPNKDVDGFHLQKPEFIKSPVLAAVKAALENTEINFNKKTACILYNSNVFAKGLKEVLLEVGVSDFTKDSSKADLLITALGKADFIKGNDIKEGAVLIDIGISKVDGVIKGDIDFNSVKKKAAFITPVPGGIGPMTIAFLMKNVLEIYKRKITQINE